MFFWTDFHWQRMQYKMHASYIFHSFFWCGIPKEQQELCAWWVEQWGVLHWTGHVKTKRDRDDASIFDSIIVQRSICQDWETIHFWSGASPLQFYCWAFGGRAAQNNMWTVSCSAYTNWQLKSPPLFLALIVYFVQTFSVQLTPRNKRNLEMQRRSSHILQMQSW